jgi:hypothetical protein
MWGILEAAAGLSSTILSLLIYRPVEKAFHESELGREGFLQSTVPIYYIILMKLIPNVCYILTLQ